MYFIIKLNDDVFVFYFISGFNEFFLPEFFCKILISLIIEPYAFTVCFSIIMHN